MSLCRKRLETIEALKNDIHCLAADLKHVVQLMEVCGTHSHVIGRFGIRQLLPESVRLISGPGCPVCVTTAGQVAAAVEIARRGAIVATFGDMVRVPGPTGSLADARAEGCDVRVIYSPMQSLDIAAAEAPRDVVLIAVGFETTAPGVGATVRAAAEAGIGNFSVLCLHKLIPPALSVLAADPHVRINGFICPGHVSVIVGARAYEAVARQFGIPCVVAGFEPEDILLAIRMLLAQIAEDRACVENAYGRAVSWEGNRRAQRLIAEVFEPAAAAWRGLGVIPESGLSLREPWARYDAALRLEVEWVEYPEPEGCCCGQVLRGMVSPSECPLFGSACTPSSPVGPCMVSSEGSCAAVFRYERAVAH
ncbi:MAG: hydrogenase formation protein HypD [Armatimonadetes bacterium]|nr:hydrogenase formation protein HypD [Armatimonadota bacterium]